MCGFILIILTIFIIFTIFRIFIAAFPGAWSRDTRQNWRCDNNPGEVQRTQLKFWLIRFFLNFWKDIEGDIPNLKSEKGKTKCNLRELLSLEILWKCFGCKSIHISVLRKEWPVRNQPFATLIWREMGSWKWGISGSNLYDFALLRQGRPGKHPIRHCFEEKWKVENGGIVLVIRILQDEPIRETRENLIPFRRMIKGRKSYIMATMMIINHWQLIS